MIPILYEATELNFTSNGVCRLAEATECHVVEERNGEYELTLTYPITGKYYDQIQEGMYIAATHDDKGDRQPFRIYRRSAPFNGLVQFFAHHISYKLNNIILNPITATSAADAFDQMETDTVTANPFTMWTDVTTAGDFDNETPASIRSALGGKRGSILDVYGGEYEWNMFTVKLYAQRGLDSDATIRYGKNLTDLTQTIDAGGLYNAIVPYWFGTVDDADVLVTLPENYVAADGVTSPVMVVMDFSSEFQDQPTEAQLRSKAASYLSSNRPWIPSENIKISFVQLWQTEEYKDVAVLQRLSLCDRVNVYYPAMGITAEGVKIIKTVYNVLLDRYDEMELGDARSTFADTLINPIENAIEAATENLASKAFMQRAIDYATKMIIGGMGGNIAFTLDANGWPIEQLIMDTKDTSTAVNVWRWNLGGLGHSHSGYSGPFDDIAITQDGKINADMITVGTMSANRIQGGTLSLGGLNNGNGVLRVYNASGTQIGKWDNSGADISGDLKIEYNNTRFQAKGLSARYGRSSSTIQGPGVALYDTSHDANDPIFAIMRPTNATMNRLAFESRKVEADASCVIQYRAIKYDSAFNMNNIIHEYIHYVEMNNCIGVKGYDITNSSDLYSFKFSDTLFGFGLKTSQPGPYSSSGGTGYSAVGLELVNSRFVVNVADGYMRWDGTNLTLDGRIVQVASTSSIRYKHNIEPLHDEVLDPHKLYDLEAKQFEYNDDVPVQYEDMREQTLPGFIAEEVAEIYPSAVIHNQDGKIESWDERRIIPGMLALIQEQKKQIDDLQARVDRLEAIMARLEV